MRLAGNASHYDRRLTNALDKPAVNPVLPASARTSAKARVRHDTGSVPGDFQAPQLAW
jgi:hypothetical protein